MPQTAFTAINDNEPAQDASQRPAVRLPLQPPRFMVCGLPRSRTAWITKLLCYQGRVVTHDLAACVDTVDQFLIGLSPGCSGTVETGAAIGWKLVASAWPDTKFVVVRRDPDEVQASLAKFGLHLTPDDLAERMAAMDEIAARPGTMVVRYENLSEPSHCAMLMHFCLGVFDLEHCQAMCAEHVEVDMPARIAHLAARGDKALALRAELADRLANPRPFEWVGFQPWDAVAGEIVALAERHYAEAEDTSRVFRPDVGLFSQMSAVLMLFVVCARVDGELVGYCIWTREIDTEAVGGMIFVQGAWYAKPDHPIGRRLFMWPFDQFRAAGVTKLRLHHTLRGRGAKLGGFFQRIGAEEDKREYLLDLTEGSDAVN